MYKNFHNYEIFADGRIWSKKRKKFLKPITRLDGYQQVDLYDNEGKRHQELVHRVVFCAVNGLWEIPKCMQINHKNEFQKHQNAIWNLELVTPKQNINHGTRTERQAKAMKGKLINRKDQSKRVAAYNEQGELVMVFDSTQEAGRNGYNQSNVAACCRGKLKHHKGYEWRYLDGEEN